MFHVVSFRLRLYSFTKVSVLNISENIRCLGPELHCLICSSAKDLELVKISPSFTSPSQSHLPRCLPSPIGGDCCALLLFYFKFLLLPPLHCFLPYNFWPWLHLPCARILEVSLSSTIVEAVIFRILFFFGGGGRLANLHSGSASRRFISIFLLCLGHHVSLWLHFRKVMLWSSERKAWERMFALKSDNFFPVSSFSNHPIKLNYTPWKSPHLVLSSAKWLQACMVCAVCDLYEFTKDSSSSWLLLPEDYTLWIF